MWILREVSIHLCSLVAIYFFFRLTARWFPSGANSGRHALFAWASTLLMSVPLNVVNYWRQRKNLPPMTPATQGLVAITALLLIIAYGISQYATTRIPQQWTQITLGLAFALTMFLFYSAAAWLRHRRETVEYWEANGWCRSCGYDIRESKDVCPECGSVIEKDDENG
jgi:hypothetical protein